MMPLFLRLMRRLPPPACAFRPNYHAQRGYTLVEMLIVVSIMIMLVAVTLPVAKKTMEGSQGREASRQLNAYFAMAKARALQTGRPCGIYFPFPDPPLGLPDNTAVLATLSATQRATYWPARQVTQMFLAEVPPPYAGGTTGAIGKIWDPTGAASGQRVFQAVQANGTPDTIDQGTGTPPTNGLLHSLIEQGEVFHVRFNYKGEWYRCIRGVSTNTTYPNPALFYYVGPNTTLPPGYNDTTSFNSGGKPFQVSRSPRPIGNPLALPNGTCVDITYSGVGNARQFPPPPGGFTAIPAGLTVMMSPAGGVDSIYINGFPTLPPTGPLYFLIGKVEKAGDPFVVASSTFNPAIYANLDTSNLADANSLWVVVNRSSGQVTTTENLPSPAAAASFAAYLTTARQAATLGEQMGGR